MGDPAEILATWRERVLDAQVLGTQVQPPTEVSAGCAAWLSEALPGDGRPARGLDVAGLPAAWRETLAWAGVPLASGGTLRWGVDLRQDAAVESPLLKDGVLVLPPPDAMARLSSVALKPLRRLVADRLECRLQAAPGIRLWLWDGRAVLQSQSSLMLAGFLYGSAPGHRASLALEPWGGQVVTW